MTDMRDEPNDPSTGERDPVERIESVIDRVLGADAGRIDVSVEHNVVFLEGSGIPPEALARVKDAVRSLPGVNDVVDDVYTWPPSAKTDAEISHDVRVAIRTDDKLTRPDRIEVVVRNGKVWLEGTVESVSERIFAVEAAKTVSWVTAVVDDIVIAPSATP
jgi:osmotically-inducible protein OsmY